MIFSTLNATLDDINNLQEQLKILKKLQVLKNTAATLHKESCQLQREKTNENNWKRLTYENANSYIGHNIKFNTKDGVKYGIIRRASNSGKTIYIDQSGENMTLVVKRKILVSYKL